MGAIALRNVEKTYGRGPTAVKVIHGINADIPDGEFIVIVGPSGCGKSTLLRMVAGLEEITGGEIDIGGRVVNRLEPAERDIAMVFQNYALYPHMSVYDNMAYGLKIAKVPKAEIEVRVRKAAKILELGTLLERRPRELSGGQRQRVAMGRAIVRQPQVFLFDEPLSNLDAKLRAQTRLEIQKLHAELGVTSLFVTHDQVEAMTLAQRMIVMNGGRIEQIGTPEQVYGTPASTFVAGFIGSPPMNLLSGQAEGRQFTLGGQTLTLPDAGTTQRHADAGRAARTRRTGPWRQLADEGGIAGDAGRRAPDLRQAGRRHVHVAHRKHGPCAKTRGHRVTAGATAPRALV
jgi:sn-glycerol 3-phosphate transport system ATP-binding protein